MNKLSPQACDYVAAWRLMLRDWLHWSEPRIERFVARYEEDLTAPESSTDSQMFFRESPIWYTSKLLQPASLRHRPVGPDDGPMEISRKIERAVAQEYPYKTATHNWDAARKRVEAILAEYGTSLPTPDEPAWYEEEDTKIQALVGKAASEFVTSRHPEPLDLPRTAKPKEVTWALHQKGKLGVKGYTIEQALEIPYWPPAQEETKFLVVVIQTTGPRKVLVFHYANGWLYWIYDFE